MKKYLLLLCALFLVFGVVTRASADYFELDHFDVDLRDVDPGLVLNWAPEITTLVGGNLDLGVPVTVDLFRIWTDEVAVNWDDMVPYPISVDFYFTQPAPPFEGNVLGETYGAKIFWGILQGGVVSWDGPSTLNFEPFGDGELLVSLSDEIFNWGLFGTCPGECKGAIVEATFELINEASPIPEPATMLLLGSGLAGLAGVRRKKLFKN
ncbi:MAG: VPLPA-CTERM sorting domain-containing protein [Deltaproteobacteria bacterium]|nr:VPLPA-CTERM sorting domain-containing protein [Deltaproteobacteria bacterium]